MRIYIPEEIMKISSMEIELGPFLIMLLLKYSKYGRPK